VDSRAPALLPPKAAECPNGEPPQPAWAAEYHGALRRLAPGRLNEALPARVTGRDQQAARRETPSALTGTARRLPRSPVGGTHTLPFLQARVLTATPCPFPFSRRTRLEGGVARDAAHRALVRAAGPVLSGTARDIPRALPSVPARSACALRLPERCPRAQPHKTAAHDTIIELRKANHSICVGSLCEARLCIAFRCRARPPKTSLQSRNPPASGTWCRTRSPCAGWRASTCEKSASTDVASEPAQRRRFNSAPGPQILREKCREGAGRS